MKQSGTSCFLLLNWKGEFMYTTISTKNMSHEEWLGNTYGGTTEDGKIQTVPIYLAGRIIFDKDMK